MIAPLYREEAEARGESPRRWRVRKRPRRPVLSRPPAPEPAASTAEPSPPARRPRISICPGDRLTAPFLVVCEDGGSGLATVVNGPRRRRFGSLKDESGSRVTEGPVVTNDQRTLELLVPRTQNSGGKRPTSTTCTGTDQNAVRLRRPRSFPPEHPERSVPGRRPPCP